MFCAPGPLCWGVLSHAVSLASCQCSQLTCMVHLYKAFACKFCYTLGKVEAVSNAEQVLLGVFNVFVPEFTVTCLFAMHSEMQWISVHLPPMLAS